MEPIDVARVEADLTGAVIGHRIDYHQVVGSTMDAARDLARDGAAEGAVVISEEQNRGRGRFSRTWVSPPGLNLYLTVLLRPHPHQLPFMNMAATLAVHATVRDAAALQPVVKWPNDVRIDDRKLSGILVETSFDGPLLEHALVGIGLNVNLDVHAHPEIADTATSLRSAVGREFDRSHVLLSLLRNLDLWYSRVRTGEVLTPHWAAILETLGKRVQLRWRDQILEGVADSVDDQGNLTLVQPDGTVTVAVAGEVTSQV